MLVKIYGSGIFSRTRLRNLFRGIFMLDDIVGMDIESEWLEPQPSSYFLQLLWLREVWFQQLVTQSCLMQHPTTTSYPTDLVSRSIRLSSTISALSRSRLKRSVASSLKHEDRGYSTEWPQRNFKQQSLEEGCEIDAYPIQERSSPSGICNRSSTLLTEKLQSQWHLRHLSMK